MLPAEMIALLPFARRYARALTGTQMDGDAAVAKAISAGSTHIESRLDLYAAISRLALSPPASGRLEPIDRQLLLLVALEEMSLAEAAWIVGLDEAPARERLAEARQRLRAASVAEVLIIEDDPVIAMETRVVLQRYGHSIAGVARSENEAVALFSKSEVGLIVADINLGAGGNGVCAVKRILDSTQVPVIFISAYPELLLTARKVEPVFVMSKPLDPVALAVFAYQAINLGRVPLL